MSGKKNIYSQKKAKLILPRARQALKNDFYLETSWLVSLAVEARLRSLITKNDQLKPGAGFTFEQCLKRMKFLILKDPVGLLSTHIGVSLIDELRFWKNQRNLILKAVESSHVSRNRLQNLAEEGIDLMERIDIAYKNYRTEQKRSLIKVPLKPEQD